METSFAIITDTKTYDACKSQLESYRDVLQDEGLGTYIVHSLWQSPEEVKDIIHKLNARKPKLEGLVFVGDIPIVMVREAQWMTTAFKMNEKTWPIFDSSVASDRYYDDFDLEFEFLERDSLRNDIFYYRLAGKGSQTLCSDIYSARMKVPAQMEGDKYEIMRNYLEKVVSAHKENNRLDNITWFAGSGYNSDCLTIWRQRPIAYREHFPEAFQKASQNRFLNFRQKSQMKDNLMVELQREDVDFMQFSEHGSPDIQYINGTEQATGFIENYNALKSSVASWYKRYKGTAEEEDFLKEVVDSVYLLPRSAISDSALSVYQMQDSIAFRNANIYLDDLAKVRSNPRIIILNACYNGSFHNDKGYVAGFHIFGKGKCVVAQANTVNVLQDKWEDKLMGYLNIGERVGLWQKEMNFLESHLIGDPTFRFKPHNENEAKLCKDLHRKLVFDPISAKKWQAWLSHEHPLIRASAITHLSYTEEDWSDQALDLLSHDDSWNVRLSALNALGKYSGENVEKGILIALKDPYEVIIRTACRIAGASGNKNYIPALKQVIEDNPHLARVPFVAHGAIQVLEGKTFKKTINYMRSLRNNRDVNAINPLLELACDSSESLDIRKTAIEVLGWYNQSICKGKITTTLVEYLKKEKKTIPPTIEEEITKTIKRLEFK